MDLVLILWIIFGIGFIALIIYLLWIVKITPIAHARHDAPWYLGQSPKSDTIPVICIGDSITHGIVSGNYVDILQERFKSQKFAFINAGINSHFVWNVNQRLDPIIQCQPQFVTILIGTNDANRSTNLKNQKYGQREMHLPELPTLEFFQTNLRNLLSRLQAETKAKIAIFSLPPMGEDKLNPINDHLAKFNAYIKQMVVEFHITYLPLNEKMQAFLDTQPPQITPPFIKRQQLIVQGIIAHIILRWSYQKIAHHNHFYLHTDHLHLNDHGAAMVVELAEQFFKSQS